MTVPRVQVYRGLPKMVATVRSIRAALCPASRCANIHRTTRPRVGLEAVRPPASRCVHLVRMRPRHQPAVPVRRAAAQIASLLPGSGLPSRYGLGCWSGSPPASTTAPAPSSPAHRARRRNQPSRPPPASTSSPGPRPAPPRCAGDLTVSYAPAHRAPCSPWPSPAMPGTRRRPCASGVKVAMTNSGYFTTGTVHGMRFRFRVYHHAGHLNTDVTITPDSSYRTPSPPGPCD